MAVFLAPAVLSAAMWALRALPYVVGGLVAAGATYLLAPQIVSFIGGVLLSLSTTILIYSGNLFNMLIESVVIGFPDTLKALGMVDGINVVWTVFRDIANIAIIGMFVFIAISIILGNKEYGQKKLVASVLIVAILINFSLLFTKMIIDGGNFTAYQFYKSASFATTINAPGAGATPAAGLQQTQQSAGVSGTFLRIVGITGFWDTKFALKDMADLNGSWAAMGWALVAAVMILMAAGVFLYGSFVMVARALLLVFVMITGPLAFATHLIPGLEKGAYGWNAWWKSLIRGALFAPLLMIFLWASLIVLSNASKGNNGSLGGVLSNPGSADNWRVMIVYLFTMGLLFFSIKLASSFATTIGMFNIASMVTAAPFTIGSRLAGFALRNTAGRGAAVIEKGFNERLGIARTALATPDLKENDPKRYKQLQGEINALEKRRRFTGWFAKQNYNAVQLAQTPVGKYISKATGITSPIAAGDAKASFAESAKKTAEGATEAAEAAHNLTKNQQEKMREDTFKKQMEMWKKRKEERSAAQETARQTAEASRQLASTARAMLGANKQRVADNAESQKAPLQVEKGAAEANLKKVRGEATTQKATIELNSDVAIKELQDQMHYAGNNTDRKAIEVKLNAKVAEKHGLIEEQEKRITEAENHVRGLDNSLQKIDKDTGKAVEALEDGVKKLEKTAEADADTFNEIKKTNDRDTKRSGESDANKEANAVVQDAINALKDPGAEAAEKYATNILARMLGRKTYKGEKAAGMFKERAGKTRVRRMLEETIGDIGAPAGAAPPPPGPAGPHP